MLKFLITGKEYNLKECPQHSGIMVSVASKNLKLMKEYVIFLDIDGVLNTSKSWKTPFILNDECIRNFCSFVNRDGVHPKIILTSSWKTGWASIKKNQTPQIIELQEKLSHYNCSVFNRTKDLGNRQKEIMEYLQTHDVDFFVIIDDDDLEYINFSLKGVFLINAETGFSTKDIKRIKWQKNK